MKKSFKKLTEQDKITLKNAYYGRKDSNLTVEKIAFNLGLQLGVSERTIRKWFERLHFKEKVTETPSEQYELAKQRVFNKEKKRFLISWAQNNTAVHTRLLRNMEAYAEFLDADIHIIAGRYKNPTSIFTDKDYEYWEKEVLPYLDAARHNVHKYVSIMGDFKIQPTAVNPMSGLEGVSGINSCIFGAPKVQMMSIPVLHTQKPKMMMTTGAVTIKDYTDSKAGKKGEFHHTYGFVVVEIKDDEIFFARQVTANEAGAFTDLFYRVDKGEVTTIDSAAAIVLGDYHVGDQDNEVIEKTLELLNRLKPQHVIMHDIFNGHSINHHEMDNPFTQYEKEMNNKNSLKNEVDEMLVELDKFKNYNVVIVRSNHDDFVDRWLINTDWRKTNTPKNSLEYMQYSAAILSGEAKDGVIPWIIKKHYPKIKTLNRSDSYVVKKWELAQHGDVGANGSRGSLEQFRRLNTKMIIGHSHSCGRKDGVLQVGTSTNLRVGYNEGPSSWSQTHCIIHQDGKAQLITFSNGDFTTFKY
jgi:hypothetical protein